MPKEKTARADRHAAAAAAEAQAVAQRVEAAPEHRNPCVVFDGQMERQHRRIKGKEALLQKCEELVGRELSPVATPDFHSMRGK